MSPGADHPAQVGNILVSPAAGDVLNCPMTSPTVRVTYYLEILSSWCHWAEPAWTELKARFAGEDVAFEWKVALMPPDAFPTDRAQCDRFYQRSGTAMRSPYRLHSGWFEPELQGDYTAPNLVAEAGKDLGVEDDRLRLALTLAAMREGRKIGRLDEAVAVAVEVLKVSAERIRETATSEAVRARVDASTAEFLSHRIDQRPAFILESRIGDKAVFSGVPRAAPLAATIESMLADARAYDCYREHFGAP